MALLPIDSCASIHGAMINGRISRGDAYRPAAISFCAARDKAVPAAAQAARPSAPRRGHENKSRVKSGSNSVFCRFLLCAFYSFCSPMFPTNELGRVCEFFLSPLKQWWTRDMHAVIARAQAAQRICMRRPMARGHAPAPPRLAHLAMRARPRAAQYST